MNTKDLRAFLTIYEVGSITKAAKQLFMTPQGLSKILKNIENELEVDLFIRSYTGVKPTYYGENLAKKAEQIINDLESIKKDIVHPKRQITLHIASTYGVIAYLSIDFLNDFRKAYPHIQLEILEHPDKLVDTMVDEEWADVGFLAGPVDSTRFEATFFTSHMHCLVIHESHPLAERETIDYSDLDHEPIALIDRKFMPYHNNMNRFLKAGSFPVIAMETSEILLTHQIASLNKAIGISVDFQAFQNRWPNTVIKPFTDPNCTWDIYLVFKKNKSKKKEAELFHDFALKWIQENNSRLFHWDPHKQKQEI